jgi:hypothetical protein
MIGEESVPIYEVQVTLLRMRKSFSQGFDILGSVKAKKVVQPFFNLVIVSISNWFIQLNFF